MGIVDLTAEMIGNCYIVSSSTIESEISTIVDTSSISLPPSHSLPKDIQVDEIKVDEKPKLAPPPTPRWLETHFWHKKRFHTETHWGYSLPIHHKARGKRFLHDAVKSSCVIHDSSYIRPIQILGTESAIQHLLRPFTVSYFITFLLLFCCIEYQDNL